MPTPNSQIPNRKSQIPKLVIIGGVAGGMSAAARARRMNEDASITVLEKGGFISFANCGMPYFVSGRIASKDKLLLTTPEAVAKRFNIDAKVLHEVTRIDRAANVVEGVNLATDQPFSLAYDKLILAPGAAPIIPPIEHIRAPNVFPMRSIEDAVGLQQWISRDRPTNAVVVGAGFIGLEMAEVLHECGLKVALVEKAPHPLPFLDPEMAPWLVRELEQNDIHLVTGRGLKALAAEAGEVTEVILEDGQRLPADLVILSIGVRPNTALAQAAGLTIGASGGIAVDAHQRTSDPDIYAAGDAAEVINGVTGKTARIPLAGPANRHGRLAGEHAATGDSAPSGKVLGTAIVQVFGLSIGLTGLSETAAKSAGFDTDTAYIHPAHHAGYYPGAAQMHIKLIYDRPTSRVLGAQILGGEGVDKRIDVIATTIHFGGTIDDLADLDLAYAPQFGSAKDPIHMAGFVAQNQQRGLVPAMAPSARNGEVLVDVRTPKEFAGGTLPGAINIPVDDLRSRLGELDPTRPTAVFCQVGMRGYIATRILRQHGFDNVRNIKGGYLSAKP